MLGIEPVALIVDQGEWAPLNSLSRRASVAQRVLAYCALAIQSWARIMQRIACFG
jgi:hypothetical protein